MSGTRSGGIQRAAAAGAIDAVVSAGRSLDAALDTAEASLRPGDRPLLRYLCYGVLRNHWRLQWQLSKLLEKPLAARDRVIESLLLVGIFQISESRVPDHAAVSMTVEATRFLRRPRFAGLVNGVLRNFLRQRDSLGTPDDESVRFNHPQWFIDRVRADWPDDWQDILEANNARAPMWLRVNPRFADPEAYLAGLDGGHTLPAAPQALCLANPRPVDELPGFGRGAVSVQDAAAQLAAPWLLAGGGRRVLDACAAPGGKTGHLLELLDPGAELTAIDADPVRLDAVRDNLERLGRTATVLAGDASKPGEWWDGRPFDRILLDAPCSASGVVRRHPDIKRLRRAGDVDALARTQRAILDAAWDLLAPGGRLLYVTCSVFSAENDAVVGGFLAGRPDAGEDRVLHDYNIRDLMRPRAAGFQVLPGTEDLDGFYYACLVKKAADSG